MLQWTFCVDERNVEPYMALVKPTPEAVEGQIKSVRLPNGEVRRYIFRSDNWCVVPLSLYQSIRNSVVAVALRFRKSVFLGAYWWNQTRFELSRLSLALFNRHRFRLRHGTPTARDIRRLHARVERHLKLAFRNQK